MAAVKGEPAAKEPLVEFDADAPVGAPERRGSCGDAWHEYASKLMADDVIARRLYARIFDEFPTYHGLDFESFYQDGMAEFFNNGIIEARTPSDEDRARWEEQGELRATQGVSCTEMLQVFRILHEEMRRRGLELAPRGRVGERLVLKLFVVLSEWTDFGMMAAAVGHGRVDSELRRQREHFESDVVRRVLFGSQLPSEVFYDCQTLGIDAGELFHAVRMRAAAGVTNRQLEAWLGVPSAGDKRTGLVARIDGDLCGFVRRIPTEPPPAPVGVSAPLPLADLSAGFVAATRAHAAAVTTGDCRVVDLTALGLLPAVLSDRNVGDAMLARYIEPVLALGQSGIPILETVECYLANDARLEQTAKKLYVHVNTVRYRIGRFEALTGCCLRASENFVEVWWALARRRLTGAPAEHAE